MNKLYQYILDVWRGNLLGGFRSSKWSSVRNDFLKKNPYCAVCGGKKKLEIHHVQSFSTRPELELSEENLLTACRDHHLWFCHLGAWASINENIREDCMIWFNKIKGRP